ncbi:FAD/NAD(P)-binding protein [Streptomyces zingiberis]|uniref:FAD/NAD(P)-binding protein n=1 Tax=Streptomyces zingiberis TaxID=2053010 RepID=A0ABX1C0H0_9ACTN|nr:FAD/NAD(P)-binding protein [Streptomyces zingiberis]NJQ01630.1 FAD/NAD(P)-binding protein [Streptomyces zingiberis]
MPGHISDRRPLVIAIVGSGPRGISVLERLAVRTAAEAGRSGGGPPRPVRVHLIDGTEVGAGRVWRTDQDDWFTMNTVVSQVTMYSGDPDTGPARPGAGPSLGEWIAERARQGEEPLGPDDYAPRVRYGRYLADVLATITRGLPGHVELVPVTGRVTAVRPAAGGGHLLTLDTAPHLLEADRVVLATGHPVNEPDEFERAMLDFARRTPGTRYLCGDSAADLPLDEETVPAGGAVGVRGLGLSFYDVMLSLTVGRGGMFRAGPDGALEYHPSGREPGIVAGSRSGLPIPARGRNQKEPSHSHRPLFLTRDALASARAARRAAGGSGQLDFAEDVLPLLRQEVEHVHRVTQVRVARGAREAAAFAEAHARALRTGTDRTALLARAGLAHEPPLDLDALARPFGEERFASPEDFRARLLKVMDEDLAAAGQGTVDGPLKAALDVLRDIRTMVREAVDFGGLLPESHTESFHRRFLPVNALLSAGPPMYRVEQLRALIRQGLVEVAGPGTRFGADERAGAFVVDSPRVAGSRRYVRTLIDARIPTPDLHRDTSPLIRQLRAEGIVRTFAVQGPAGRRFVTGGMEVTPAPFHVVDAEGTAQPDLYALGIPTEHTRWFTQVGSSRPGLATLFYRDADAIAADALRPLERPAGGPPPVPEPVSVPGRAAGRADVATAPGGAA